MTVHANLGLGLGFNKKNSVQAYASPIYVQSSPEKNNFSTSSTISAQEFTFHIKFAYRGAPSVNNTIGRAHVDANNYLWIQNLSNGNISVSFSAGGTFTGYTIDPGYFREEGNTSITVSAKVGEVKIYVNGIKVYTISNQAMLTGDFTSFGVGELHNGNQEFEDDIIEFLFYGSALSDHRCMILGRLKTFNDFGLSGSYSANRLIHYKLGQSNSVGTQATAPGNESEYYDHYDRMEIISKSGDLITSYVDPSCTSTGGGSVFDNFQQNGNFSSGGIEINGIAEHHPDKMLAVMHIDRGNTGLINDSGPFRWIAYNVSDPNITILNSPAYQSVYMQMMGALYGVPHSRTWWQGESDASDIGILQLTYRAQLVELISLWNQYIDIPTIVVGLHESPSSGYDNWANIQAAQSEIQTYVNNAYHVSAQGASTVVDEVHLNASGYASIGEDISTQINAVT